MFRNYLAAALRNLVRNRLYAAINIVGLAVGFAAALFAALFVRDELTYERWIPRYERVFHLTTTYAPMRGIQAREEFGTFRTLAAALKLDFPEVETAARLALQRDVTLHRGDRQGVEPTLQWADPDIFKVLAFPAVAGDLAAALTHPDGVVLTRSAARQYFSMDAPIGEGLEVDGHLMQVMAVIEDWPSNTAFTTRVFASGLAPFSRLAIADAQAYTIDMEPYMMTNQVTYVRLKAGASFKAVDQGLRAFVDRHVPRDLLGEATLHLRPLASLHLNPLFAPPTRAGLLAAIYGIAGMGALIILAASINFINLMTARASRRAVEVAVRKATGAERRQLIVQFIGEAMGYMAVGMIAGLLLVESLLPAFRGFLGRRIEFNLFHDPVLGLGILGVALSVGVLSGFYPAFVLSGFHPATVLKGSAIRAGASGAIRQGLVVLQFAILIGLAIATGVIYQQTSFAMNESLRFEKGQALFVASGCMPTLKSEIQALPGVQAAACSWGYPGYSGYIAAAAAPNHTGASDIGVTPVDFDYFETFGLTPSAGRFFDRTRSTDEAAPGSSSNPTVVINQAAMRELGFASPQAAIGKNILWQRMLASRQAVDSMPLLPSEIIGVVDDFSMSVQRSTQAQLYYADMRMSAPAHGDGYDFAFPQMLNVRLTGQDVPETLAAIDRLGRQLGHPQRPIKRLFVDQRLEEVYRDMSRQARFFASFCGVAMLIAGLGLFALAAFTAEQRTKEIGVRKAMGAGKADILRLLVWEFAKPVLWANALAWPAAYLVMRRWLEGFAYHIDLEARIFIAASVLALLIAVLTVAGHALLVARTEPASALRYE
jgi:putative ABC transport system permease protein